MVGVLGSMVGVLGCCLGRWVRFGKSIYSIEPHAIFKRKKVVTLKGAALYMLNHICILHVFPPGHTIPLLYNFDTTPVDTSNCDSCIVSSAH